MYILVGTVAFLLGVCITLICSRVFQGYDGKMIVGESEGGKKLFSLELDGDPTELEQKKSVFFKVTRLT